MDDLRPWLTRFDPDPDGGYTAEVVLPDRRVVVMHVPFEAAQHFDAAHIAEMLRHTLPPFSGTASQRP